jgi:hypothetical protein
MTLLRRCNRAGREEITRETWRRDGYIFALVIVKIHFNSQTRRIGDIKMLKKIRFAFPIRSSGLGPNRCVREEEEPEYVRSLGAPQRSLEQGARAAFIFRGDSASAALGGRRPGFRPSHGAPRRGTPARAEVTAGQHQWPRSRTSGQGWRGEGGGGAAGGGAAEDGDGRGRHGRGLAAKRAGAEG